jgi:hypothetical protein
MPATLSIASSWSGSDSEKADSAHGENVVDHERQLTSRLYDVPVIAADRLLAMGEIDRRIADTASYPASAQVPAIE